MALRAGKHVLCEKPMALNAVEARAVVDEARARNLFFLQGVWSRFFPAYARLRQLIDDGSLGEVLPCRHTLAKDLVARNSMKN